MTADEVRALLEPAIEGLGYELIELELRVGRDGLLQLFIDHPDGIGLDDCETVSRQVSAVLDVEDPIPGHYALEVSSPGVDRALTKPEHFERFAGEDVRIRLRTPIDGRRNYRGALRAVDGDSIEVEVDGQAHRLPMATIASARLVPALQ